MRARVAAPWPVSRREPRRRPPKPPQRPAPPPERRSVATTPASAGRVKNTRSATTSKADKGRHLGLSPAVTPTAGAFFFGGYAVPVLEDSMRLESVTLH